MTELTPLARIQRAITPFDVYIKEAKAYVAPDYDARYPDKGVSFQIRHGLKPETERIEVGEAESELRVNVLRYVVDTGVRFVDEVVTDEAETSVKKDKSAEANEPIVRAEITSTWLVEYRVLKMEDVDLEGIQAFSENNVMYHVWPYWREFVHASCARLRLPQIMLPTFRLKRKEEAAAVSPVGVPTETASKS
ncbi:MAG: hypothetical protein WD793_02035 [Steroidobacteraceae bacterium]